MRKLIFASILATLTAYGEIPAGYYSSLTGKSGETLKEAVKTVAYPSDFSRVSYGPKTWDAFLKTDVRVVNG
ncbi:MAG: hypothetical protein K2H18_03105, partial [Muribaculaceae bacterium]|nr:hypothetical protein [Muribaculaceae bacterium]